MKIYKIRSGSESTKYSSVYLEISNPCSEENFYLGKISNLYEVPIKYQADNKNIPEDYPICANAPLVSTKLLKIIKGLSNKIQVFPSEIYYNKTLLSSDYHTVVFTNLFSVLDWDKSIYEKMDGLPDYVTDVKKLVVSKNKLPEYDKIFLMKEDLNLLITEEGKKIIEDAGITGVRFIEVEVS